jgi:hypothetical protein
MWFDLEPGRHAVGFEARFVVDATRQLGAADGTAGYEARPVRILVWYPARAGAGTPMRYGDYLRIEPRDARFLDYAASLTARDRDTARRQFSPASDSLLGIVKALTVAARRDAPPAAGPFPLVLHSLGLNDYQLESTVLWEYLASHGYVVAVVPQVGAALGEGLRFGNVELHTQALDLGVAIAELVREPWVDGGRVGLVGHSFGALAALYFANENTDVDVVVSLDGSIGTDAGAELARRVGWTFASVTAPLFDLYRARTDAQDRSIVDSLRHIDRYVVILGDTAAPRRATHFDFQNWPVIGAVAGVEDPRGARWRPGEQGVRFYLTVCRLTRSFLAGTLKGETAVLDRLRAGRTFSDVDEATIAVEFLRGAR